MDCQDTVNARHDIVLKTIAHAPVGRWTKIPDHDRRLEPAQPSQQHQKQRTSVVGNDHQVNAATSQQHLQCAIRIQRLIKRVPACERVQRQRRRIHDLNVDALLGQRLPLVDRVGPRAGRIVLRRNPPRDRVQQQDA
jgi:hypothetical protein